MIKLGKVRQNPEIIGNKSIHKDFIEKSIPEWLARSPLKTSRCLERHQIGYSGLVQNGVRIPA